MRMTPVSQLRKARLKLGLVKITLNLAGQSLILKEDESFKYVDQVLGNKRLDSIQYATG